MPDPVDHSLAAALQRVLLPPGLPDVPAWALATLYEPAGEAVLVGGDFYDWFTLPNGNVLFFVGDVSGKGPVAGALGMSIRKALKGITWVTEDPATALPVLQQALADELGEAFATLCLLELTPDRGQVRVMLAGHPAPWVRHQGVYREVEAPENGMLGLDLQTEWKAAELDLEPGDTLVLFSDGLTEARLADGELFGEGSFQSLLQQLDPELSSFQTALRIDDYLRAVTQPLTDDVVIAVVAFQPAAPEPPEPLPTGQLLALRLSPHPTAVPLARRFVADACRRWAVDDDSFPRVELVTSELVTNAVDHSRTELELRVAHTPTEIRIEVWDRTPAGGPPASLDTLFRRDHGLDLVRSMAADAGVDIDGEQMVTWATVALAGPEAP